MRKTCAWAKAPASAAPTASAASAAVRTADIG
jgi:hypothetical protein